MKQSDDKDMGERALNVGEGAAMANEGFVSYGTAMRLKRAGFDLPCHFYYTREDAPDECVWSSTSEEAPIDYNRRIYAGCSMPTLAQAQKWLIAKGVFVEVSCLGQINNDDVTYWSYELVNSARGDCLGNNDDVFEGYSACLLAGIRAALKLIEEGGA